MEESQKIVQLKGRPTNELLEQIKTVIGQREVQKICLFISFKSKKEKNKIKIEKSLQDKTYQALNSVKQKKQFDQMLQNAKSLFNTHNKQQLSLTEQISKLYEQAQYMDAIKILLQKQINLQEPQNHASLQQTEKYKFQFNFISFSVGNCYYRIKKYDQAISYYQKSKPNEDIRQRAQRMNNLGTCFAIKGSYQQALKAYNQAIKSYSQLPEQDVSSLLNNLAMIYMKCEMYKTAEQYFQQSIKERKAKSPNNKSQLYISYFNLGICQKKYKKLQQSINNFFIALNYAYDGFGKKPQVLNEICIAYQLQQKWSEALSFYEKLSEQYEKSNKPQGSIYERVSKIHQKLGNKVMAAKFAKKAFKIYYEQGNQRKLSQMSASPLVNMPVM